VPKKIIKLVRRSPVAEGRAWAGVDAARSKAEVLLGKKSVEVLAGAYLDSVVPWVATVSSILSQREVGVAATVEEHMVAAISAIDGNFEPDPPPIHVGSGRGRRVFRGTVVPGHEEFKTTWARWQPVRLLLDAALKSTRAQASRARKEREDSEHWEQREGVKRELLESEWKARKGSGRPSRRTAWVRLALRRRPGIRLDPRAWAYAEIGVNASPRPCDTASTFERRVRAWTKLLQEFEAPQ
jgi:hypothetical protein